MRVTTAVKIGVVALALVPRDPTTPGTAALKALIRAWTVASSAGTIFATRTVAVGRAARIWSIRQPEWPSLSVSGSDPDCCEPTKSTA